MDFCQFSRACLAPLASAAILLAASTAASATESTSDYFLKFDGIGGSSTNSAHKGWIDMLSFSWGATQPSITGAGGSVGTGKTVFSNFEWTQALDASITGLFTDIGTAKRIPKAIVELATTTGGSEKTYFKMTFNDVVLTKLQLSGTGGLPSLAGSFAYSKMTVDYPGLGSAQSPGGAQIALVPEPDGYAMFLAGLGCMGMVARRRRSS